MLQLLDLLLELELASGRRGGQLIDGTLRHSSEQVHVRKVLRAPCLGQLQLFAGGPELGTGGPELVSQSTILRWGCNVFSARRQHKLLAALLNCGRHAVSIKLRPLNDDFSGGLLLGGSGNKLCMFARHLARLGPGLPLPGGLLSANPVVLGEGALSSNGQEQLVSMLCSEAALGELQRAVAGG